MSAANFRKIIIKTSAPCSLSRAALAHQIRLVFYIKTKTSRANQRAFAAFNATRADIFKEFWPGLPIKSATNVFHVTKRKIGERLGCDLTSYAGDGSFESLSTHLMWVDEFFRLNVPDFWFVHLPLLGLSSVIVGLLALTLLGVTIFSAWKVWLMLR